MVRSEYLTAAELKSVLHYDSITGIFTRLSGKGANSQAGSINKQKGYVYIRVNGTRYMAHRLAWLYVHGEFPKNDIDHIDQVKHNNAIANLRDVTKNINQRNRPINSNSTSKVTGVYFNGYGWVAQITVDGKCKYLGTHSTKEEAYAVRQLANKEHSFSELHGKDK